MRRQSLNIRSVFALELGAAILKPNFDLQSQKFGNFLKVIPERILPESLLSSRILPDLSASPLRDIFLVQTRLEKANYFNSSENIASKSDAEFHGKLNAFACQRCQKILTFKCLDLSSGKRSSWALLSVIGITG